MRIGTKSVLVGAHQFLLHPLLIALGWFLEYGLRRVPIGEREIVGVEHYPGGIPVPTSYRRTQFTCLLDPRLWLAFVVHDLGYLGKPNMDGPEGERHPELGARVMRLLFGDVWGDFVLLHSRYYAKALDRPVSALCHADKRVIVLEPSWLYLPRVWASGELREYLANARRRAEEPPRAGEPFTDVERAAFLSGSAWAWHRALRRYMARWIAAHRGGGADTWTRVRHAQPTA